MDDVLVRRVQRIAVVAIVLAVVACATGFVPDGLSIRTIPLRWTGSGDNAYAVPDPGAPTALRTSIAGGWTLVAWTFAQLVFALIAFVRPSRGLALGWGGFAFVTTPIAFLVWAITERGMLFEDFAAQGIGRITIACAGAAGLLLAIVLPIVALASRRTTPGSLPLARSARRSRGG